MTVAVENPVLGKHYPAKTNIRKWYCERAQNAGKNFVFCVCGSTRRNLLSILKGA
jgi:hypothetical protein